VEDSPEKVVVLTSARKELGKATGARIADEGAVVWLLILIKPCWRIISGTGSDTHPPLGCSHEKEIQRVVAEAGVVDVLCQLRWLCSSMERSSIVQKMTGDYSFEINVKSMYRTCRAVLPMMLKAGKGNIINVASAASSIKAAPNDSSI